MSAEEWLYGFNPVLEAIKAGRRMKVIYISLGRHEKVIALKREAEKRRIPVEDADKNFFNSFPKGHQGIAAKVTPREYVDLDDVLAVIEPDAVPFFVILDCIEDPRNLGAILRSADAAGVHGVILQSHRAAGLGSEVYKTSAGAAEYVPVSVVANIKHAIHKMRERGITIIGAEAGAHPFLWEMDLTVPVAVVIGSEGKGLRRTVKESCDLIASLPMKGRVNSLNTSVAAGIVFFEILRQRSRKV